MRVLILEPHATGHHVSYLRWLIQACRRKQLSVVVATTTTALLHPSFSGIATEFEDTEFHLIKDFNKRHGAASGPLQLARREFAYWKAFKKAVEEVCIHKPVDQIILPYIDYCFHALSLFGAPFKGIPWCAISMRLAVRPAETGALPRMSRKWRVARRILAEPTLKALFVINPSVEDIPADWYSKKIQSRLRYLPDPAAFENTGSRRMSRASLGLPDDAIAILVFGTIDERKGTESLLRTVISQPGLERCVVILAGKQSEDMQHHMQSALCSQLRSRNRLIVLDRFLNDSEQVAMFAAADVVWVGYRNHAYMSGVLVLAGRAGLAVVGTNEGEIGRLLERHRFGLAVDIKQPTEIARALRAMFDVDVRTEMGKTGRLLFATHTIENFGAVVLGAFDA